MHRIQCLAFVLLFSSTTLDTSAQGYSFANVVDSTTIPIAGANCHPPAINDSGELAILAGASGSRGVYRASGGLLTPVATAAEPLYESFDPIQQACFQADINNSGTIAFWAELEGFARQGIFVVENGQVTAIADTQDEFLCFLCDDAPRPSLNNSGWVAFTAALDDSSRGIFVWNGAQLSTLYSSPTQAFSDLGYNPALADSGQVSFYGHTSTAPGLFAGFGGPTSTILDYNSLCAHGISRQMGTSPSGKVVYSAHICTPDVYEVFVWDPATGETETAAIGSGIIDGISFQNHAINTSGEVVFLASLDGGGTAIFSTTDLSTPVVRSGDPLFGSTVTTVISGRESLNAHAQIAFQYALADGRTGYAVASLDADPPDIDEDGVPDTTDNCPSVANADQADGGVGPIFFESPADGVGNACDNCLNAGNPRVAADFLATNPWATLTGGQRDDDHDGYGNKCDAKFTDSPSTAVGSLDFGQFRSSSGEDRRFDTCGSVGRSRPCAVFDLDESVGGDSIGSLDLVRFRQLSGAPPGPRCSACTGTGSVLLPCTAGTAGVCSP